MTTTVIIVPCILQEDVFLAELTAPEAEVSIEIPVLVGQRGADTCVGDGCSALHWGEVCMIIGSIGHEASSYCEMKVFGLIVDSNGRFRVEVLCVC